MLTALSLFVASILEDAKTTDLGDGYVQVETKSYSIEVPQSWKVSSETPWGARKVSVVDSASELGVMTAGKTQATWEELYRTSLFFIQREESGKATPYILSKTAQGYDACSFSVLDNEGFAKRRYVLLKSPSGYAVALSVKISGKNEEASLTKHFDRLVKTAKIADSE